MKYAEIDTSPKSLFWIKTGYLLIGLAVIGAGVYHREPYEYINALGSLLLLPALWLLRKLFHIQGGYSLEGYLCIFISMSWTIGGAGGVYALLPGYDKVVHCLSGVLVSMLALAIFPLLDRENRPFSSTSYLFTFFTSAAVAGLFELCEFTLAPVFGRDLQHVLETGVGDTMMDMLVCLGGTLVFLVLMALRARGTRVPLVSAALSFSDSNKKES